MYKAAKCIPAHTKPPLSAIYQITGIQLSGDNGHIELTAFCP
jgi:hypothetical protein